MSNCPHCRTKSRRNAEKPGFLQSVLGFHKQCEHCGGYYLHFLKMRPLSFLLLSILLFQFLSSLVLYPVLDLVFVSEVAHLMAFILCHLALLPVYWLMGVSLTIHSME